MLDNLGIMDKLPLLVGLLLGLSVILLIRSRQMWRRRQALGYDVFTAERAQRRLAGWAVFGIVGAVIVGGVYLWSLFTPQPEIEAAQSPEASYEEVPTLFLIPRLALETEVIEAPFVAQQWDISRLHDEVAHLEGTASPGEPGNIVLAGHVTVPNAGWGPFKDLETLNPGDRVYIEQGEATYVYEVSEMLVVSSDDVHVTFPTEDDRLTLITCTGWSDMLQSYTQRYVVIAHPAE